MAAKTKAQKRAAALKEAIAKARTRAREAGPRARAMPLDLLDVTSSRAGSAAVSAPNSYARPQGASTVHPATPTVDAAMAGFPTPAQAAFAALRPPAAGAPMAELQAASVQSSQARVDLTTEMLAAMQQAQAAGASTVAVGNEVWHVDPVTVGRNLQIEQQALANNQAIAAGQPVPFPNAGSERSGSGRRNRED